VRITKDYPLSTGAAIFYHAEDVRKERTGVHAKVIITFDKVLLAWTSFNVERDEDRTRLANSAYKALGDIVREVWSQYEMKHALDLFCAGLWEATVALFVAEEMEGGGGDEAQDFPMEPFIVRGGGTMLYAPPGRGKSYTALLKAVSVDAGCDSLFPGVSRPRRGFYINIERSRESMRRRLMQVNTALGLEPTRPLLFLNARGKSLSDIIEAARKGVREHQVEVAYLDSISRAGFGDLNENSPVNRIIDVMNGLCETWYALAHTPRSDESHIYGSVHFDAGIDIGVQMLSEAKDDGRTMGVGLKITKANDIRKPALPFMFALEFDDLGLCGVRQAGRGEFLQMLSATRSPVEEAREYLLSVGEGTASEIGEIIGKHRSEVSRMLNMDARFGKRKAGKHVFFSLRSDRESA
jgi:hypothetical protein